MPDEILKTCDGWYFKEEEGQIIFLTPDQVPAPVAPEPENQPPEETPEEQFIDEEME